MKKITLSVLTVLTVFSLSGAVALAQGNSAMRFNRSLSRGSSGDDVRDLQTILAADPTVYPEGLVTGYYGPLTEKAMMKFQAKNSIEQVGIFGPKTRARMHTLLASGSTTISLPPGLAKKLPGMMGSTTFMGSTTAMMGQQIAICHVPKGNALNKQSIIVGGPAVKAHLAHGDTLGSCNGVVTPPPPATTTSTTTPPQPTDTAAPVISSLAATGVMGTSTTIIWVTNEAATTDVWYSTSTPIAFASTTAFVSNPALVTGHTVELVGLSTTTTYFYVVSSADAAGNRSTSTTAVFTTTN